jgi:hypothetical protein
MANPNARLMYAITDDNVAGVEQALAEDANPNGTKDLPALAGAIGGIKRAKPEKLAKKMQIVEKLLAKNADPNFEGPFNRTPLYEALNRIEFVQVLLDKGANATHKAVRDYQDEDGQHHEQTNLIHAAISADAPPEVIMLLRRKGADIDYPDHNGAKPLDKVGRKPEIKAALEAPLEDDSAGDVEMQEAGRRRKTRGGRGGRKTRGARKTRRKRTLRRR